MDPTFATMRVTLLDDHQTFRESLRIALWHEASIKVVGESESARKVVSILETERPDLLVADLMLEDTDGISMARDLGRRGIATPVMILTAHSNALFVRDAFDAGVQGYALKEQPLTEIVEAMRKSAAGERYLSPRLGSLPAPRPRVPQSSGTGTEGAAAGIDQLSRREREIFCLIIQGTSSRDIAQSLCISLKTVETHRSHINRKLGVHSPAELIRLAALKGLLLSGPNSPADDGGRSTVDAGAQALA
jgi:two-component system response regulator NreC